MNYIKYLIVGVLFGFILTKAEVISWFRIQEMFRFQDFHMYGVLGSAVLVAMISIQIIKKWNLRDKEGAPISIPPKDFTQKKRYVIGGTLFGFGWAFTGACPAPLFALFGSGITIFIVPILAALAGTYVYGAFRESLPH
ncbi:YeeE/YedE thiosulfate transporter family protein [Balneolales bacterium ANBcel1]|nr:YeeE/YedE thiosulfate transporter family protein [Balneolales bacterium ANBcel1]